MTNGNPSQYLGDMVDMGETYDDGPSELISKEEEKKPHYPDIYGLNISGLQAVQDTKVGEDVIIVIKAKVKSLEVRETQKNGKKATACLEIRGAAAYPIEKQSDSNNKVSEDTSMPMKPQGDFMNQVFGDMSEEDGEDE